MAKLVTNDLVSLANQTTAIANINGNMTLIETAMENTLSRDGTSPNEMEANLDMNSHRITNLPAPIGLTEPVRLQDVADDITINIIDNSFAVSPYIETLLDDVDSAQAKDTLNIEGVSIKDYGAIGDGVTDDTIAIQAAIDAVGKGLLIGSAGNYLISDTIVLRDTLHFRGEGKSVYHAAGYGFAPDFITQFTWGGAAGGTMVRIGDEDITRDEFLAGGSFTGIGLSGEGVAGRALEIISASDWDIDFSSSHTTITGLYMDVTDDTRIESTNNQNNHISCFIDNSSVGDGDCVQLEGNTVANTSVNLFGIMQLIHRDGDALIIGNTDNNVFHKTQIFRFPAGTGVGVRFRAAATQSTACRANTLNWLQVGDGGVYVEGTETDVVPAWRNRITDWDDDNYAVNTHVTFETSGELEITNYQGETFKGSGNVLFAIKQQPQRGVSVNRTSPRTIFDIAGNSSTASLTSDLDYIQLIQGTSTIDLGFGVGAGDAYLQTKAAANNGSSFPLLLNPAGGGVTINNELAINTTSASPVANDGLSLGISGTAFSDLFLASGAVINWNAGDIALTHTANTLTYTGMSSLSLDIATLTLGAALNIGTGVTTGSASIELGTGRSGDGNALIDFHGESGQDYDLRIIRAGGVNGAATIEQTGAGILTLQTAGGHIVLNTATNIRPNANDGTALGVSGTAFADLFLASGGVINFNAGDVVLTHSADALTMTGGQLVVNQAGTPGRFVNSTDSVTNVVLRLESDRATPTNGDVVAIQLFLSDSAGTQTEFARISGVATDVTDTSEDGSLTFGVTIAGTLTNRLTLTGTTLQPVTNDTISLGTASLMFADLFLASGSVINWNAGNATLTHSAGLLTSNVSLQITNATPSITFTDSDTNADSSISASSAAGSLIIHADQNNESASSAVRLSVDGTAYLDLVAGILRPAANDATSLGDTSLMFSDLFLASGAVINFNNGNATLTHAAGFLTSSVPVRATNFMIGASAATGSQSMHQSYTVSGINFNSANTDTAFTLVPPAGYTRYRFNSVVVSGASASLTTATFAVFTDAAGAGTAMIPSATACTVSTASEGTNNNSQLVNGTNAATISYNDTAIFFRVQTPQGSAATATATLFIQWLS